jgi:hypothetical protein
MIAIEPGEEPVRVGHFIAQQAVLFDRCPNQRAIGASLVARPRNGSPIGLINGPWVPSDGDWRLLCHGDEN